MIIRSLLAAAFASLVFCDSESWQEVHCKSEHNLDNFDAGYFFSLHDQEGDGTWTPSNILYLYGLAKNHIVGDGSGGGVHDESRDITQSDKDQVVETILKLVDADGDGKISMQEWIDFVAAGGELPDFGYGPGHHGDYEEEYELHHWQQFHAQDDPDMKVIHPEDIEHERLYHAHEHGEEDGHHDEDHHTTSGSLSRSANIPAKFRISG